MSATCHCTADLQVLQVHAQVRFCCRRPNAHRQSPRFWHVIQRLRRADKSTAALHVDGGDQHVWVCCAHLLQRLGQDSNRGIRRVLYPGDLDLSNDVQATVQGRFDRASSCCLQVTQTAHNQVERRRCAGKAAIVLVPPETSRLPQAQRLSLPL